MGSIADQGTPSQVGVAATGLSEDTVRLRQLLANNRDAIDQLLAEYHATNPRLFGSVARGDATRDSDIDIMVDLPLIVENRSILSLQWNLREKLSELLAIRVDVFPPRLMKPKVTESGSLDAIPLWDDAR